MLAFNSALSGVHIELVERNRARESRVERGAMNATTRSVDRKNQNRTDGRSQRACVCPRTYVPRALRFALFFIASSCTFASKCRGSSRKRLDLASTVIMVENLEQEVQGKDGSIRDEDNGEGSVESTSEGAGASKPQSSSQQDDDDERGEALRVSGCLSTVSFCMNRFRETWPRTFHILFRVIIPLLGLIGVCFFCGYFLARMESSVEMSSNDAIIATIFNDSLRDSSIAYGEYIPDACLADWNVNDPEFNETGLRNFLDDCRAELISQKVAGEEQGDLTFDWIICDGETPYVYQYEHVLQEWTEDYFRLVEKYATELNMTFWQANERALQEASGHEDCTIHTSAGAWFFFTVLTTIGYGNTAPTTTGGRTLIYTLGFLSILLFGSVIGWAGHISIVIFDDFCLRCNLQWLIKGFVAPLFWLSMLALWLLVLAALSMRYSNVVGQDIATLADAYYFMYISITTVGLGDYYLHHETINAIDVFITSFLFLLGFVLMANFLLKLKNWLSVAVPVHGRPLEDVLKERRNASLEETSQQQEEESAVAS